MKKRTSEVIKRIIPHRSPRATAEVCKPWKVPSRVMSRHHWYIISRMLTNASINSEILYVWNHLINPIIIAIVLNAPRIGHGLTSTKW